MRRARVLGLIAIVLLGGLAIVWSLGDDPDGDRSDPPDAAAAVAGDEAAAPDPPDPAMPSASGEAESDAGAEADAPADEPADEPASEEPAADPPPADPPPDDPPPADPPPDDPPPDDPPPDDPPDTELPDTPDGDAPEAVAEAEADGADASPEAAAGPAVETVAESTATDETTADTTTADEPTADDSTADDAAATETTTADEHPADDAPAAEDATAGDAAAAADAEPAPTADDEASAPDEAPVISGGAAAGGPAPAVVQAWADSLLMEHSLPTAATPEVVVEPRRPLVVLDPGHGGDETGARAFGVVERESNLDFAFRVELLLQEAGFDVLLTRRTSDRPRDISAEYPDAPGFVVNRPDLQARVDLANEAGADIFVSIHSNGASDPRASGVEVYWNGQRPHAEANQRLALALQESVLESLRSMAGYRAWDRGIREDSCWETSRWTGECSALFLLGPPTEIQRQRVVALGQDPAALGFAPGDEVLRSRATQMPAALLELLFITNEWEAGVLKNEIARRAIAAGIVQGILRYFAETAALAEADADGAS